MLFKQLLYFTTVAETLNISAAANKLFVSQPPISRQIMLLEKELGVQLFIRKSRGLELTGPGLILYRQTKDLFANIDAIVNNVKEEASSFRGTLKLGSIYSGMPFLIKKINIFKRKYPEVQVRIQTDTPDVLLQKLETGQLSAIFLRNFVSSESHFSEVTVSNDPLRLLLHEDLDPDSHHGTLKYSDLKKLPICTLRPDDIWKYSELFMDECRKRKIVLNVAFECNDTPSIMQLVNSGLAAACLPITLLDTLGAQNNVCAKKIPGISLTSPLAMIYDNSAYLPTCMRLFIRLIRSDIPCPPLSKQQFE